jgi:hypothetical protein
MITTDSACDFGGCSPFPGFEQTLEFNAEHFDSGAVTITVITPEDASYTTDFDLDVLK